MQFFKIIKHNFILLLGVGLTVYNLFGFNGKYPYEPVNYAELTGGVNKIPIYYYNDIQLTLLAIGVILIVIGILKLRKV